MVISPQRISRADALRFRDLLVARGVAQATVKRNFECVRAIWNFTATENAIDAVNPFSNMNYGNGAKSVRRLPIPQSSCVLFKRSAGAKMMRCAGLLLFCLTAACG